MAPKKQSILKALGNLILDDGALSSDNDVDFHKILLVGAEAAPYAAVGGFASVLGYLSRELVNLGQDVRLFMPKYGHIDEDAYELEVVLKGLEIPTGNPALPYLICNVKQARKPVGVPVYFLENQEYYEKRANVYGYVDDPVRWALLCRGVLEFIKHYDFKPDIIHVNDWHTGLVPNYLKTIYAHDKKLADISTVFTIHNMQFQGNFDHRNVSELDLDDGRSEIAPFFDARLAKQNFLRRGILFSNAVNTVSHKYSKEVLTPEFGEGLDKLLLETKEKFFGITNGIDYKEFDPAKDKLIPKNYDVNTLSKRAINKASLQKEFDLPVAPNIPLFGFVGRLDYQKGVDLAVRTLRHVLSDHDIQFVQVGGGDASLAHMLQDLKNTFPDKVGIHLYPNFTLPRLLFSGCDTILYPSRFEPCGVVQLEAMRYGAIPIVRKVGGLADTVQNFDSETHEGTGFVFNDFNEFSLYGQIVRAIEIIKHPHIWEKLQFNAMSQDFSWTYSAKEYVRLYSRAQKMRTFESKSRAGNY